MPLDDRAIGFNLRRARCTRGLSQYELAATIGMDRTALSRIETGRRALTARELPAVARAVSVPIEDLLKPLSKITGAAGRSAQP